MVNRWTVIGDATVDIIVRPSQLPRPGGDVAARIAVGPGGQGANVAVRLARLGATVALAAPIAEDAVGTWLAEILRADGVEVARLPAERSSSVVILLDAAGERSMLSDRQLLPADGVPKALGGADWIHASAYPLLDDRGGDPLVEALRRRPGGSRLSVAGGSIPPDRELVDRFRARLATAAPDLLLVSLDEATSLLGGPVASAAAAAAALRGTADGVVVTAGTAGSAAVAEGHALEVQATTADGPMIDATGAGDAFLAALLWALAPEPWPPDAEVLRTAMQRASQAGAEAARVMGAQGPIRLEDRADGS